MQKQKSKFIKNIFALSILFLMVAIAGLPTKKSYVWAMGGKSDLRLEFKTPPTNIINSYYYLKVYTVEQQKSEPESKTIKPTKEFIPPKNVKRIVRKDGNQKSQEIIDYIFNKTKNVNMILTFQKENGSWDVNTVSKPNSNGTRDYGICQVNSKYHSNWIKDPRFKEWKNQADYCIEIYLKAEKKGTLRTTFYAYNIRSQALQFFNFK